MGINKIIGINIDFISKVANVQKQLISKVLNTEISFVNNTIPLEYKGYKILDLSNYYSSYRRVIEPIQGFSKVILIAAGSIEEGYTNWRGFVYNVNSDVFNEIPIIARYFPGTEDEDFFYFGIYDYPEDWTTAGVVKVNKSNFSSTRYIFDYHTIPSGPAFNTDYVFFSLFHGGYYSGIKYFRKSNGLNYVLNVFSSNSYPCVFASRVIFNNVIVVTGLNYYRNQTSCPVAMVNTNTLQMTQLGTVNGNTGIGNMSIYYGNPPKIFLTSDNTIYEYSVSPFSLISSYSLPTSFNSFIFAQNFPTYFNQPDSEPLMLCFNYQLNTACNFYVFNFDTKTYKNVDLSSILPALPNLTYVPILMKEYLIIFESSVSNLSTPIKFHIFKINAQKFWDII